MFEAGRSKGRARNGQASLDSKRNPRFNRQRLPSLFPGERLGKVKILVPLLIPYTRPIGAKTVLLTVEPSHALPAEVRAADRRWMLHGMLDVIHAGDAVFQGAGPVQDVEKAIGAQLAETGVEFEQFQAQRTHCCQPPAFAPRHFRRSGRVRWGVFGDPGVPERCQKRPPRQAVRVITW